MRILEINKKTTMIIVFILIFIIPVSGSAQEFSQDYSIEEAIAIGLENSKVIKDAEENLKKMQRDIARILAQEDWQVNLNADYTHTFNDGETRQETVSSDYNSLDIAANRSYRSGLKLNSRASLFDGDLNPDITITLSQPIFPALPTDLSRTYYKKEKDLLKAEKNLKEQKASSVLSWLESYLSLNRMDDKYKIYLQSVEKAEANLTTVLQRIEIGDAGQNQLLTDRLSLENAKYMLRESEKQIENAQFAIVNTLGLPDNEQITITDNSYQIKKMKKDVKGIIGEYLITLDIEILDSNDSTINYFMDIVEGNSYELENILIDREVLEQELNYLEEEGKADIVLNGSYNTSNDEISLGLSLSYPLYDSGIYKMDIVEKELEIENNIIDYDEQYIQLKQELKILIDKIELSKMSYSKEKLNLEKSEFELEVAEKQLVVGLIDYLEYQDYWISAAEAKVNLKSLEDQLFIDRLELIKFIDTANIAEIIGGF